MRRGFEANNDVNVIERSVMFDVCDGYETA